MKHRQRGAWPPVCVWPGCDRPRALGMHARGDLCEKHQVVYDEQRERQAARERR